MTFSKKHCLITGTNTGLGLAVSKKMAHMGAHTILLCRNNEKGEKVFKEKQLTDYWQDPSIREHLWSVTQSLISVN